MKLLKWNCIATHNPVHLHDFYVFDVWPRALTIWARDHNSYSWLTGGVVNDVILVHHGHVGSAKETSVIKSESESRCIKIRGKTNPVLIHKNNRLALGVARVRANQLGQLELCSENARASCHSAVMWPRTRDARHASISFHSSGDLCLLAQAISLHSQQFKCSLFVKFGQILSGKEAS